MFSIIDFNILKTLNEEPFQNQRDLATRTDCSLGIVNKSLKTLKEGQYLSKDYTLTRRSQELLHTYQPNNAIILAAGFGMRMVPINTETPKGLLQVKGEILIERLIEQLHDAGIQEIHIIVGFQKEKFEYLIDKYHVDLIVNRNYASKNNLYSLFLAKKYINNTYILPANIWSKDNPFARNEAYSWYMVTNERTKNSAYRINRNAELVKTTEPGNKFTGIAYLAADDAKTFVNSLTKKAEDPAMNDAYWEVSLQVKNKLIVHGKEVSAADCVTIKTYEDLRELDENSSQLHSDVIETIAHVFSCTTQDVTNITVLKKGMTNRSFIFTCNQKKYIMRIPGEGTDHLISRKNEAEVYSVISGKGLCDDPVYINPNTGYKITAFLENVRTCDPTSEDDLEKAIKKLRQFHQMHLTVDHTFDLFGQIEKYESFWNGAPSLYSDYKITKEHVMELQAYINKQPHDWCLTHIDAVCDNFLFYQDETGQEQLQLTDWEYAGMQDPHVDLAMFCIYSFYDKSQIDHLLDIYFNGSCSHAVRCKIYCYVAICGLLWSNWCEYKAKLGIEFGEYSLRQYRYAKEYWLYATEMMKGE